MAAPGGPPAANDYSAGAIAAVAKGQDDRAFAINQAKAKRVFAGRHVLENRLAAYVAGPQEVEISYRDLSKIIPASSPIMNIK